MFCGYSCLLLLAHRINPDPRSLELKLCSLWCVGFSYYYRKLRKPIPIRKRTKTRQHKQTQEHANNNSSSINSSSNNSNNNNNNNSKMPKLILGPFQNPLIDALIGQALRKRRWLRQNLDLQQAIAGHVWPVSLCDSVDIEILHDLIHTILP